MSSFFAKFAAILKGDDLKQSSSESEEDEDDEYEYEEEEEEEDHIQDNESKEEEHIQDGYHESSQESESSITECSNCSDHGEPYNENWYVERMEQQQQNLQVQELKEQRADFKLMTLLSEDQFKLWKADKISLINSIQDKQLKLQVFEQIHESLTQPELLIEYIELLIQYAPEKVIDRIKDPKYPTQLLQLTQSNHLYESSAMLLLREGRINEYLEQIILHIDQQLRYYLREKLRMPVQLNRKIKMPFQVQNIKELLLLIETNLDSMGEQIFQQFKIFDANHHNQDTDQDLLWYIIFQQIVDWQLLLESALKTTKSTPIEIVQIINLLRMATPSVLLSLIQTTDIDLLIDEIQSRYSKINVSVQNYSFGLVFRELFQTLRLLKAAKVELLKTHTMVLEILKYIAYKARRIEPICSYCNSLFTNVQTMVAFKCHHTYHLQCLEQPYCLICPRKILNNEIYRHIVKCPQNHKQVQIETMPQKPTLKNFDDERALRYNNQYSIWEIS